ncbi:hypothetical protein EDD11_004682 [Mortierella claussenii]|nr:hypothetical protein EDD11_004682 [Mortierella claussenii]
MSGSAPTVKDVYKAVTADLAAFLSTDNSSGNAGSTSTSKPKEGEATRETIQSYLDRFVKSQSAGHGHSNAHHHGSNSAPSSAGGPLSTPATPLAGNLSTGQAATFTASNPASAATPGVAGSSSMTAAGQRHANELWYQSLTNNTTLQHSSNLPFAFHRLSHASSTSASPGNSAATSQNPSISGSPVIGGGGGPGTGGAGGQTSAHPTSGHPTSVPGATADMPSSPSMHPAGTVHPVSSSSASSPLAAQRFSAHLITLYMQNGMETAPIAAVASRMIVYLTHLLPFLTPHLIILDWWGRLIEPALQGEIKLEKDSLKACRDLVTECMVRDNPLDGQGSGVGSLLVAGDEEGQLETSLAMAAMPISQFVLRKYIKAAHRLNHCLADPDRTEQQLHSGASNGPWLRANTSSMFTPAHTGHGSSTQGISASSPSLSSAAAAYQSEYPSVMQDMEKQHRLLANARAIIRRKKDILVKNLEVILFAYGGSVGRAKDFFSCLYTYFVGARYRAEILGLLCQFIRRQTPVYTHDTSPLIVWLGLMTLIMLMPRIPATLNDRLPDLFLILSRILCWPRSRHQLMAVTNQDGANLTGQTIKSFDEFDEEGSKSNANPRSINNSGNKSTEADAASEDVEYQDIPLYSLGIRWRRYGPAVPGETNEGAPDPTAVFSFLYGLFPCNVLQFLHSPRAYMKQALSPIASPKQGLGPDVSEGDSAGSSPDMGAMSPKDDNEKVMYIDEDLLKSRVQSLLKRHSLHPDLLTQTPEQETSNKARWQKLEPTEIVAMCVGLDVWSAGGPNGTGPVLRPIDGDRLGLPRVDSDDSDEEEVNEAPVAPVSLPSPLSVEKMTDVGTPEVEKSQEHSLQAQALASVESLGSDNSEGTPLEILAQEDFFGPRAVKDMPARTLNPTTISTFYRPHAASAPSTPTTPRTRTRSKEVKMSQILRNFATLRGLEQEEFLAEANSSRSLGPSLLLRERRGSVLQSSEDSATSAICRTATTGHGDIPLGENAAALISQQQTGRGSLLHSATMDSLVFQNQEYRKTIVHLERDLLVAKNELNFELFLKQQHIQQISRVHRAHVLDASVEAERQNLYNTCRSLKAQLQETKLLLEKEKTELEKRKNKQTHWDTELKSKMQVFRDERKQLQFEAERLKQDIKDTRQAQEIQERLLTDERKGTFQLKNTIEDLSPKLKRLEEYEKRIEEMTRQLVLYETEQTKVIEVQRQMEAVVGRWQNLELLLAAEREEARTLRNRISQQSQVLDDMRIQLAITEGRDLHNLVDVSTSGHGSDDGHEDDADNDEENDHTAGGHDEDGTDTGHVSEIDSDAVKCDRSSRQKTSNNVRHRSSNIALDKNWPTVFTRSNSSQQGFENQRRAAAMQEFLVREKERWDQELQEAHNRWSREAMRNQQLEDRILELQSQLETARAIDVRKNSIMGGNPGGHNGGHHPSGGGSDNADRGAGEDNQGGNLGTSGTQILNVPTQPQNVPYLSVAGPSTRMSMHDNFGDADTDDGGIGSSGMIGRYSHHNQQETEDEDDTVGQRMRSMRLQEQNVDPSQQLPSHSSTKRPATIAGGKGKSAKFKSKSKWSLDRAHTDKGTYGGGGSGSGTSGGNLGVTTLQSHLGTHTPGILDIHRAAGKKPRSGDSSSTVSSSAAARAASGGLFAPMMYTRQKPHLSDCGSSDVTTASDTSTTGSVVRGGSDRSMRDAAVEGEDRGQHETSSGRASAAASVTGSVSGSSTGKKSSKSKADRERDRERERIRLMSGMGPLVDPSKMYRNVRMF